MKFFKIFNSVDDITDAECNAIVILHLKAPLLQSGKFLPTKTDEEQ